MKGARARAVCLSYLKLNRAFQVIEPHDGSNCEFLTVLQVSQRLGVSTRAIYGWITAGRVPSLRFGRVVKLRRRDVEVLVREGLPRKSDRPGHIEITCVAEGSSDG